MWIYISDLAGKDIDIAIIAKLLFYLIPSLIPMVLPLTILVASIMTFGSFSEHYEFAAMKSSGISLQRAMKSVVLFITLLSITTFFFANNVIPWSRYKAINMRNNIAKLKPAIAIVEGQFNQIAGYNIKVEKKTGENGQDLHDVLIHKKKENGRGMVIIKAKTGKLIGGTSAHLLTLVLYDGTLYQRVFSKDYKVRRRRPFIKNGFEEYRFNIDLSDFNQVNFNEEDYDNVAAMLNLSELRVALDSLTKKFNYDQDYYAQTLRSRNGMQRVLGEIEENRMDTLTLKDSIEVKQKPSRVESVDYAIQDLNGFYDSYELRTQIRMTNLALTITNGTIRTIKGKAKNFRRKIERLNETTIEIHNKFALAVMCYVLFFVGAPMGAIIKKGGLGTPMIVAIILFLIYYYIGMFAKNSAQDGSINAVLATWISTIIMLPLSILLTYQATTDRKLVNFDVVLEPMKRFVDQLFKKIGLRKRKKNDNNS